MRLSSRRRPPYEICPPYRRLPPAAPAEINETINDLHTKNVPYRFVMTNPDEAAAAGIN